MNEDPTLAVAMIVILMKDVIVHYAARQGPVFEEAPAMTKNPSNHGSDWTPGDMKQLRQLARENTPTRVIGLKMGRTPAAVQKKASSEGVSPKPTNQSPYSRSVHALRPQVRMMLPLPAHSEALMSLIDLLPSDAHLITLSEGEVIFAQGDRGELMYVVVKGEAQILIEGKVVETVGPGGILGEMALIDAEPRSATALTKTRCVLIPIDEKVFTGLVTRQPEFALQVMRVLAYRLRMMDVQR